MQGSHLSHARSGEAVCPARRLGQPVARRACHDVTNRGLVHGELVNRQRQAGRGQPRLAKHQMDSPSVETFDALHYGGMTIYKLCIILFNLVAYIAVRIVG